MEALRIFRSLDKTQRATFLACFLGWTLDALDFFLLTFVVKDVAAEFSVSIVKVTFAITLTLMMRPLGALIFGLLGDRFGRRVPLMVDIIFYSLMELLTAFSPNYTVFLIFRGLYGVGMGGEWGLGASLTMESLPAPAREPLRSDHGLLDIPGLVVSSGEGGSVAPGGVLVVGGVVAEAAVEDADESVGESA